ncbi:hypothetical protein JKF63_03281 [Porcisia hertigi]|uniref:Exocyst complex component Sec6 n=1 Tax=Porcisia hertigi TaxID=2761500 RepID=A0A836IAC1_9TRYP|nr:hypothetical protein JKF63_03281 [Porcisia hertigi]
MSRSIAKGQQRATEVVSGARNGFTGGGTASASGVGGATGRSTSTAVADSGEGQFYTAEELLPHVSEEEKATLRQEVLHSINTELLHNTDLEVTVPRLLRSCQNESRELRRTMNSIASSQIGEAQRALHLVKNNHGKLQGLRELFLKQGELIQGFGADTLSYRHLRQLHFLRDNVSAVIKWSEALKEVRYGNLYALVEKRSFRSLYDRLRKLQLIRRTVITKAGVRYRSFQAVFEPYFDKLDVISSLFVNELFTFLRTDAMVVAIQKALEDGPLDSGTQGGINFASGPDGTGDDGAPEPFECLRQCIIVCGKEIESPVFDFGSDGVQTESQINEDTVYSAVAKGIAQLWGEQIMQDVVDPVGQISIYLDQMKKVDPLLGAFELTLFPLSTKFSFFSLVVQAVHAEVMGVMQNYIDRGDELGANALIEASLFIQWYCEMMETNNYAPYVDVSLIAEMSASFMTAAVGGLSAHLTRLCRACAITVCNDPKGPTILPTGIPITTGPVDLFSVLQQSLSGLNTSFDRSVMRKIGKACADSICAYIDECRQRSDFDYWEDENNSRPKPQPSEEWQQRRMLFLYAFCNDCTTIENNLDTVELKFASCWDYDTPGGGVDDTRAIGAADDDEAGGGNSSGAGGDDGEMFLTPFEKVQEALLEAAFSYLDEITAHVERVVEDQWAKVFRPGEWYTDATNPVQLIVDTEAEYIEEEFVTMLPEQRSRKLTLQMLTRNAEKYMNTLIEFLADVIRNPKKNTVDNWLIFVDCVQRDIDISVAMWSEHISDRQGQLLDLAQRALEVLRQLLSVKKAVDFDYLLQDQLLDDFGDCPTFVIRFCFVARSQEIDRETRERLMDVWSERIAYQKRDTKDMPTVGWSRPPSLLGTIDRSLAELEKPAGLFGRSVKKRRAAAKQQQVAQEKSAKRAARKARLDADAAVKKVSVLDMPRVNCSAVEVATLSSILN